MCDLDDKRNVRRDFYRANNCCSKRKIRWDKFSWDDKVKEFDDANQVVLIHFLDRSHMPKQSQDRHQNIHFLRNWPEKYWEWRIAKRAPYKVFWWTGLPFDLWNMQGETKGGDEAYRVP